MAAGSKIGLHVSAAGGVENAPENAKAFGAECFQFFSRSPRGGKPRPISPEQSKLFRTRCKAYGFESYVHTPYYINFASKNKRICHGSIAVIQEELARGSELGVAYVMTHLGSASEFPEASLDKLPNDAVNQVIDGLKRVFAGGAKFHTKLLLEMSAGAGAVIGDRFEELAYILRGVGRRDIGICLDTCHLFASGYDIRTPEAVRDTLRAFEHHVGLSRLKLVHANDSMAGLGEHKDRHEHIGKGKIGSAGFRALLHHPAFRHVNFILETPHDEKIKDDIVLLKRLRA